MAFRFIQGGSGGGAGAFLHPFCTQSRVEGQLCGRGLCRSGVGWCWEEGRSDKVRGGKRDWRSKGKTVGAGFQKAEAERQAQGWFCWSSCVTHRWTVKEKGLGSLEKAGDLWMVVVPEERI